jgi:hypothetical protein
MTNLSLGSGGGFRRTGDPFSIPLGPITPVPEHLPETHQG